MSVNPISTGQAIGFIGLGRLGGPLATNLAADGYVVTGFDRNPAAESRLHGTGVSVAATAADAARGSTVLMTCVRGRADLDAALDAIEEGQALSGIEAVLDFSTISPTDSAELASRLAKCDIEFLRVAVSGSAQAAAARQVAFICSGDDGLYARFVPLLDAIGRGHTWVGPEDEARAVKIAVNMLVGVGLASLIESVQLAERLGIDRQTFLDVVRTSAVGSPFFTAKTPALVNRDYTPAASLALMKKDLELAVSASGQVGSALPVTALALDLYAECDSRGWGERDFACLDDLYDHSDHVSQED